MTPLFQARNPAKRAQQEQWSKAWLDYPWPFAIT